MPKFNVGDRVRLLTQAPYLNETFDPQIGDTGIIDGIEPTHSEFDYSVRTDLAPGFFVMESGIELVEAPPVADKYTVRNDSGPLEIFNDLESARAYRDGYNRAIYYWADNMYAASITIDVEEVQTVTVTKGVE